MLSKDKVKVVVIICFMGLFLCGCDDTPLISVCDELFHRGSWNDVSEDFMLRVNRSDDGITFHSTFIVRLIGREEEYPKDMDMVVIDKDGLVEVIKQ